MVNSSRAYDRISGYLPQGVNVAHACKKRVKSQEKMIKAAKDDKTLINAMKFEFFFFKHAKNA